MRWEEKNNLMPVRLEEVQRGPEQVRGPEQMRGPEQIRDPEQVPGYEEHTGDGRLE